MFFHRSMVQHWQHNQIYSLIYNLGDRVVRHANMEEELVRYFLDLLLEEDHDREETMDNVLVTIPRIVLEEHNEALMREI